VRQEWWCTVAATSHPRPRSLTDTAAPLALEHPPRLRRPRWAIRAVIGAACVLLAACTANAPTPTPPPCTPTLPNGLTPPGEDAHELNHGNGRLWTVLWPSGVLVAGPENVLDDGRIAMKFPWFRSPETRGPLEVTGHEVSSGAMVAVEIPDGYGQGRFQPSGLIFPTEGCYEIVAESGDASLTFVTQVRKAQD
jgi:hypothetical protein